MTGWVTCTSAEQPGSQRGAASRRCRPLSLPSGRSLPRRCAVLPDQVAVQGVGAGHDRVDVACKIVVVSKDTEFLCRDDDHVVSVYGETAGSPRPGRAQAARVTGEVRCSDGGEGLVGGGCLALPCSASPVSLKFSYAKGTDTTRDSSFRRLASYAITKAHAA